jgi:hypothetical protein
MRGPCRPKSSRRRTGPQISGKADEQIDWPAIRCAYEASDEPLAEIGLRFGVSRQRIQGAAKREGWRRPLEGIDGAALAVAEGAEGAARRRIVARLFKALDEKMRQIEDRIAKAVAGGEQQSAADAERDARALSALAGLYAKLVALDEAAKAQSTDKGTGPSKLSSGAAGDADGLREDLARRLRLLEGG